MKKCITLLLLMFFCFGCSDQERSFKEIGVGDTAPDFCVKDLDGNVVILSYFEESPVVLRFFETDCRFCRADTPVINTYYEKYREKGLKVFYLSASTESKEKVENFLDLVDVTFPVIMDHDAKIADLYNVLLYPQTIILGPGRKVLAIVPGGVGEAELNEVVGVYLTKTEDV